MNSTLENLMISDGHRFSEVGGIKKCCCPFHKERSPSFVIYDDGHFHCFGCQAHGDAIGYVMRRDGVPYAEAIKRMGISKPMSTPFKPATPESPILKDGEQMIRKWTKNTPHASYERFAHDLGVDANSLYDLDACFSFDHQAWAFPMRNRFMNIVGIRLRKFNGEKFSVRGGHEGLFIPAHFINGGPLFIVEGPTDAAAAISMDLGAIGRPNCTGAVPETVRFIKKHRVEHVVIISDNDGPGLKGSDTLKAAITGCRVTEIVLPTKDIREFKKQGGTKAAINCLVENAKTLCK